MTDYPNWFAVTAQRNFEQFLIPLAGQDNLKFLQLGVFTGDASIWLLENVLTGNSCWLYDIDTWEGSDELDHESMDFNDVFATYKTKIESSSQRVTVFTGTTVSFLTSSAYKNKELLYDFIYIDADHTTVGVLLDAELSWPLLKSGGIMGFDDYTWGHQSGDPRLAPQVGIDLFLHRHRGDYELLTKNTQVWIRKL
jgi:hypothetical protein